MRKIPGFEGYFADNLGGIYNAKGDKLAAHPNQDGYLRLHLRRKGAGRNMLVHRLVALAYHGYPQDRCVVQHINGDRTDNRPENLKWGTHAENSQDSKFHGTANTPHTRKLTPEDVVAIRRSNDSSYTAAAKYGVQSAHIRRIRRRMIWRNLP